MTEGHAMIIVEMKKHFQLRAIEWYGAGALTSVGFFILLNPGMFLASPASLALLELAPQQVWGIVAFVAGLMRLCALFVNGLWYRTPAVRWLTTMLSIFVWFSFTAAFAGSTNNDMSVVIFGWHILADMYSAYRAATDFIEAETQRRLKTLPSIPAPVGSQRGSGDNVHRITSR